MAKLSTGIHETIQRQLRQRTHTHSRDADSFVAQRTGSEREEGSVMTEARQNGASAPRSGAGSLSPSREMRSRLFDGSKKGNTKCAAVPFLNDGVATQYKSAAKRPAGESMSKTRIDLIRTLGPTGTNCEAAAHWWFERHDIAGVVALHPTLEDAAAALGGRVDSALLGCMVYPNLHTLVFSNLDAFVLEDIFVFPTHNMVVASRHRQMPKAISTHPAPQGLAPVGSQIRLVNSNAQAALDCAAGLTDGCITTRVAAEANGLVIVRDHGPIPMGFSLHRALPQRSNSVQRRPAFLKGEVHAA